MSCEKAVHTVGGKPPVASSVKPRFMRQDEGETFSEASMGAFVL